MALVVEDSIAERTLLTSLARSEGLNVVQATDAESALASVSIHAPDVILLDIHLPGQEGMTLLARIREEHPFVPVVMVSSTDECSHIEDALNLGAVSFLRRPIRSGEFQRVMDHIGRTLQEEEEAQEALHAVISRRTNMSIPGDPALFPRVVASLGREVRNQYPGIVVPLADIKLALYEALANAVQHGNLEIGYDHKGQALDRHKGFRRLMKQRLTTAPYAERLVHIRAEYEPEEVVYRIRDEGRGFDPHRFTAGDALSDPERLHGRGLALIRHYMDEVAWHEDGREIQMTRRLGRPRPTPTRPPPIVTPE